MTLIELLAVLTILGVAAGVSALAIGRGWRPEQATGANRQFEQARAEAIRRGRAVMVRDSQPRQLFLPDGRVVGADGLPVARDGSDAYAR